MHSAFKELAGNKLLYKEKLTQARIVNRPNRYVAFVTLPNGKTVRAHTPVGGRIGGLTLDGLPCLISGPYEGRATDYTVQAIGLVEPEDPAFQWIGINQGAANSYVKEFLLAGLLPNLTPGLTATNSKALLKPEKKLGASRIDFFVEAPTPKEQPLWIEVKTPLIKIHATIPASIPVKTDFPSDSVGKRMPKQITDLFAALAQGDRVAMLGAFIYENTLKSSDELKLKDNLNLEGLLTTGKKLGLESWQITMKIDAEGVELMSYNRLL